jgi:tetratricopeptide (TPR) repeat protein
MSQPSRPSLAEISSALEQLADRINRTEDDSLEPFVSHSMRAVVNALEYHIPGLEAAPDLEAARGLLRGAERALERGQEREALSRALRGLAFAPHDPSLWYMAGSACFELGQVEDALRLLCHTLWIHPGHRAARADLEALSAFFEGDEGERAA